MPSPTADERERRIAQYLSTLHRGQLAEFRLTRMNRVADFRKQLIQLIDQMIETRAEEIAAGMMAEHARPDPKIAQAAERPVPRPPKRSIPVWIRGSSGRTSSVRRVR